MKGNVTKTGYWPDSPDRNNDFNIIPSNNITMEGMDMPLMGISNKGDKKLMMPGKNYKFKGKSVMETPVDKGMFLGHFQFKDGGLVRMDPGGPVNSNFKPSYDWKKSPEENAELNKRAEAAGHNSVAEYEKSGWAWQPEKTHFTKGEGQSFRKAEPKQQSYYDKNLSVQHVVDEAKRAAPAIAENQNKSKYKMYDPKNKYANLYDEDAAGLPSVPIFESLLMAPVALGSAGLAGLGEATYAAGAASPFLQATGAALGSSPAWAPGLSLGNTMAAADLAYVGNQVLDSDSDLRQSVNVAIDNPNTDNIINAVANVGLAGLDVLGAGVIGDIGKGGKGFKGLPKSPDVPANEFNTKGAIGDLFKRKNFEEPPLTPLSDEGATSVLNDFRTRMGTQEGQRRLKNLGITDTQNLDNMQLIGDPNVYANYDGSNVNINPKLPLKKQVTRHEIEHGVSHAVMNSKVKQGKKWYDPFIGSDRKRNVDIYNDPRTEIDKSLETLDLELKPQNVDWSEKKGSTNSQVEPEKIKELISDKQNATNYFVSGSDGNEKSTFLSEAQQYMMDNGDIPKDSYVDISPEMVKKVYERAKTDEAGGGKYLRIFNIMKPNEKNFKLISDNLNKMLAVPAAAVVGDQIIGNQPVEEKKNGGIYLGTYKQVGGQLVPHDISVPNLSRQDGGPSYQVPARYKEALQNFVYPIIDETDEYTGYNPLQGQINQDTRPGSIENNDWWMQHELLHHLQNLSGEMSSLGPLGKRPNLTTASNEAIEGYYDRRDNDVNRTIDNIIAQDPSLQFIPRDKLRSGSEPDENGHLSFVGAENLQYEDPSTLEGEARQYEQYIRNGNPSIFPKKQHGGPAKRFNTKLRGAELEAFNQHAQQFPSLATDTGDYDTQGFYKEVYNKNNGDMNAITAALTPGSPTAHVGNDRYKKPNHPTFSKESKYHVPILRPAGEWGRNDQGDYFNASRRNIKNMTESDGTPLDYFKRAEDYNQNGVPDTQLLYRGKSMFNTDAPTYELPEMKPSKLEYSGGGSVKRVRIKSLPNNWKSQ